MSAAKLEYILFNYLCIPHDLVSIKAEVCTSSTNNAAFTKRRSFIHTAVL